jgi:hypothetical protein
MFGSFYDAGFAITMLKKLFGWRENPKPVENEATVAASTMAALDAIFERGMAGMPIS